MSPIYVPGKVVLAQTYTAGDPYLYTNTVLLLKGDGTNGSTTILDSSKVAGSPKTVTAAGNAQISTVQSKFGGSSISFAGGTGSRLTAPNTTDLALLSADFTVEMWAYFATADNEFFYWNCNDNAFGGLRLIQFSSTSIQVLASTNGSAHTTNVSANNALSVNSWQHIAVSKQGSALKIFVDGIEVLATTITGALNNGGRNNIGGRSFPASQNTMTGYIDDLRITKGISRYNATFTPPTASFDSDGY
jgi:hypothetical protein